MCQGPRVRLDDDRLLGPPRRRRATACSAPSTPTRGVDAVPGRVRRRRRPRRHPHRHGEAEGRPAAATPRNLDADARPCCSSTTTTTTGRSSGGCGCTGRPRGGSADRAAARRPSPTCVPRVRGRRRRHVGDRAGADGGHRLGGRPDPPPRHQYGRRHATRRLRHQLRFDLPARRHDRARRGWPRSSGSTRSGPASTWWCPSPRVVPSPMEPEDPILDPLVHLALRRRGHRADAAGHRDHHPPAAEPAGAGQAGRQPRRAVRRAAPARHRRRLPRARDDRHRRADGRSRRATDDYLAAMRALWTQPGPGRAPRPVRRLRRHRRPPAPGHARRAAHRRRRSHPGGYRRAVRPRPRLVRLRPHARADRRSPSTASARRPTRSSARPSSASSSSASRPAGRLDPDALDAFAAAGVDRSCSSTASDRSPADVEQRLRAAAALVA